MTSSSFSIRSRTRVWLLGCVLALLAAGLAVALRPHPATAAGSGVRPGQGYRIAGGDFVGYYRTVDGRRIYCLSPRKAVPGSVTLHPVGRFGGISPAASAALAYALATWGDARTDRSAAVESQVVNTLVGNAADVARRSRSLPASLRREVAEHVAQSSAQRGPYAVRLHLAAAETPGRSAVGEVRVRTAGGHWLTGATLTLTHSANVSTPHAVRTDPRGLARFTYRVNDVGEVSVSATVNGLAPTGLVTSTPGPGEQRMVTWQPRTVARAGTRFRAVPTGFSHAYDCSSTCDGKPATRLQACAPASSVTSRLVYRVGGRSVTATFPASRRRSCVLTQIVTRDGDVVAAAWQFRTAHGWSAPVAAHGGFTVDCPPAPPVGVTMSYDCAHTTVTIGLARIGAHGAWTPLVNDSRHRTALLISGGRTARIEAAHGATALWSVSVPCGARVTLTVRAGVQRSSGGWNYGPSATVTTP